LPHLKVLPLQGGMGIGRQLEIASCYPDILAKELAEVFNAPEPFRLAVPAFIDYQTSCEAGDKGLEIIRRFLERDKSFQMVSESYELLDVGLVGIGAIEKSTWAWTAGYLSSTEETSELQKVGACGDIVCRFFRDIIEDPVETKSDLDSAISAESRKIKEVLYNINRRAIGISLSQLRRCIASGAHIIAFAGGDNGVKACACYGAIINGYITDLVTDEITAEKIIECAKIAK
jgi:DNA-binding transcriptional regulator LsrR (DeoR family)